MITLRYVPISRTSSPAILWTYFFLSRSLKTSVYQLAVFFFSRGTRELHSLHRSLLLASHLLCPARPTRGFFVVATVRFSSTAFISPTLDAHCDASCILALLLRVSIKLSKLFCAAQPCQARTSQPLAFLALLTRQPVAIILSSSEHV